MSKVHTHKYIRAIGRITKANQNSGMIGYYKCADPTCSHYQKAELILGKKSICNRCGAEFILPLAVRSLTNRPHCKKCTKKKDIINIIDNDGAKDIKVTMDDWLDLALGEE